MNHDLRLRVEGAYPERLLARALEGGAHLARVRRGGPRTLILETDEAGAEIVLALCRKYGLNHRVLQRGGASALMDRLRSRWTLALGMALCALMCFGFLSRIWIIDIAFTGPCAALGNEAELRRCIEAEDLHPGMAASGVEADLLERRLLASCGDYSYIGVRVQGIRLLVEASPEVPAPMLYRIDRARDLVAARDGVVESVTVHAGEACVKAGDTVRRGQTLIRGEEDVSKEETGAVAALGEVVARCWYEGSAEGPLSERMLRPTGRSQVGCSLKLMSLSLPLAQCEGYEVEQADVQILPVVGLFVPLEIVRTTHREMEEARADVDCDALQARLTALARAQARARIAAEDMNCEIISSWEDVSRERGALRVRAVYEVHTDIAVTRDALTEEGN